MKARILIKTMADLLGVQVTFPEPQEERREPQDKDYRLTRQVWYDGTVHWVIEQFVSTHTTLRILFPNYPTIGMIHVNGKPQPNNWIPLPQKFSSEEEAIEYLNETLRAGEVMEESHYYID